MRELGGVSLVVPRLDAKPWGGRRLEGYGLDLPAGETIGEALVTAGEARIVAGDGAGRTLGEIVEEDPAGRLGARAQAAVGGRAIFPLLVKLIDAAENLSIQVHPDDEGAAALDRLGKTEAWHVLAAEPGGRLHLGLRDGVSLDDFMEDARKLDGSSERALRSMVARPGMTVMIPAGTIHALGAGVMIYEIQQPSDVTFRLDDWGRIDAQGRPRAMHLEQGQRASREELRPGVTTPVALGAEPDVSRLLLAACRYFALERIHLAAGSGIAAGNAGSPEVITALTGMAQVGGEEGVRLEAGASVVVWPGNAAVSVAAMAESELLRAWVPDLEEDVILPARAAGAGDAAIAALGGETGDVAATLASAG